MKQESKVKKSLRFSFWDGVFANATTGLINNYVTPYALFLKATSRQIGSLTAFPFLASCLVQLIAPEITEKAGSRLKIIRRAIFFNALILFPIILIPHIFKSHPVFFLIIFMALYTGFNSLAGPVWCGLISEYIPADKRGRYFSWRNRALSVVLVVCSYAAGLILHLFRDDLLRGFFLIFSLAMFSRFLSWYFTAKMYEPAFTPQKEAYFSLIDFIKNIRASNFARFVVFVSSLHCCVNLAAPFFSVFMLRDLKFNYLVYTIISSVATVIQILVLSRWGRFADRFGNVRVLKSSALIIATLPLWWVINQNPVYLVFAETLSGFAWAGFNLSVANFVFDAVSPQKRIRCQSYFNLFVGLAVFLGAMAGGRLAGILPNIFGWRLSTLFVLSSTLRLAVVFLFYRKIKEVRNVKKINTRETFFAILGIKDARYQRF